VRGWDVLYSAHLADAPPTMKKTAARGRRHSAERSPCGAAVPCFATLSWQAASQKTRAGGGAQT